MRMIPFDIKYRPQIESGEYKVVTDKGNQVRILDWNLNRYGRSDIVCAVKAESSDNENVQIYYNNGVMVSNGTSKLKIETNEPELTDFEAAVRDLLNRFSVYVTDDDVIKREAAKLLKIADDTLCDSSSIELPKWETLEDCDDTLCDSLNIELLRWRKSSITGFTSNRFNIQFDSILYDQLTGYEININDLLKLPKIKIV